MLFTISHRQSDNTHSSHTFPSTSKVRVGFTVVELVVVITVIAILAVVVTVSYGSITARSKKEAVKGDLQATSVILKDYKSDNGTYPASLSSITPQNKSTQTTYTYQYKSAQDSYCLSASGYDTVVNIESNSTTVKDGACAALSGVTITNLVKNPSLTGVPTGLTTTGASNSAAISTSGGGDSGAGFLRISMTGSGPSITTYPLTTSNLSSGLTANTLYTLSGVLKSSKPMTFKVIYKWVDASSTSRSSESVIVAASSTSWTRFSVTGQFANVSNVSLEISTTSSSTWSNGDWYNIDSLILTTGQTAFDYGDGTSTGWSWSGTANNSASSGPARVGGSTYNP
ncbi:MAG: hypothetical protein WAR37_01430 [Candidatus Microsaccharimonas sp.]